MLVYCFLDFINIDLRSSCYSLTFGKVMEQQQEKKKKGTLERISFMNWILTFKKVFENVILKQFSVKLLFPTSVLILAVSVECFQQPFECFT